tara:strand:- start:2208 stop:2420 length:213 start_codon:yes stop_codon:yes gene_type:complete
MLALASGRLRRPGREHDDGDEGSKFHLAKKHWVHGIVRDRDYFNALFWASVARFDAQEAGILRDKSEFPK